MKFSKMIQIITGRETRMQRVMRKSWALAKKGQKRFGGSSKEYLSISMKEAWFDEKDCNF